MRNVMAVITILMCLIFAVFAIHNGDYLIGCSAGLLAVIFATILFSLVKEDKLKMRKRLEEELEELRHRWRVCLSENECARELNAKTIDGAVDRGSEDEWRRRLDRQDLIAHNGRLIETLRLREVWIKKKLGI